MASLEQRIGEGIVAHFRANAAAGWYALVGGTGSAMRIAYSTERKHTQTANSVQVRPLGPTIISDDFGDSGTTLWQYEVIVRLGTHLDLQNAIASLGQDLQSLFRPDLWGSASLRAAIQTADTEGNIRGEAIDVTAGQPEYDYDMEEGDPAKAEIRQTVAVTCDHVLPLVYA